MGEIEAVIETGIYIDDPDQTEAFYRDVVGLSVIGKEAGRHVFFRVGQRSVLQAFHASETIKGKMLPSHGTKGPGHFAWELPLPTSMPGEKRLRDNGVIIEKGMQWPRGAKSLYFRDPPGVPSSW